MPRKIASRPERAPSGTLTPKELALIGPAMKFMSWFSETHNRIPSANDLRKELRCGSASSVDIMRHLRVNFIPGLELRVRKAQNQSRHDKLTKLALLDQALGGDKMHATTEEYYIRENSRLTRALEKSRMDRNMASRGLRDLSKRTLTLEDDLMVELARIIPETAKIREKVAIDAGIRPQGVFSEGHTEDVVFVSGDQHYGAQFKRMDVTGFPEYNIVVGANRTEYITRKCIRLVSAHREMYHTENLWWAILGDIGNGGLHDSPMTNELFIPAQVDFSFNMLDLQMQNLLSLKTNKVITGDIIVIRTVGNHMRTDVHMPLINQAQRTNDWLICQMLYNKYKSHPGIQFVDDDSPFVFVNIKGHRYCFTHGSQADYVNSPDKQIKSLGDMVAKVRAVFDSPVYRKHARPFTPPRDLAEIHAGYAGETFAAMVIGNIHVPVSMPRIRTNGSLPGQNELGVNWTLEPIPAGQWLFGVDQKRSKTFEYFLDATEKQEAEDNEFTAFAREYRAKYGR